jgi:hypothetical protein
MLPLSQMLFVALAVASTALFGAARGATKQEYVVEPLGTKIYVYPETMRTYYCPPNALCMRNVRMAMERASDRDDHEVVLLGRVYRDVDGSVVTPHAVRVRAYDPKRDPEVDARRFPASLLVSRYSEPVKVDLRVAPHEHTHAFIAPTSVVIERRHSRREIITGHTGGSRGGGGGVHTLSTTLDPYPPYSETPGPQEPNEDNDNSLDDNWWWLLVIIGGALLAAMFAWFIWWLCTRRPVEDEYLDATYGSGDATPLNSASETLGAGEHHPYAQYGGDGDGGTLRLRRIQSRAMAKLNNNNKNQ